MSNQFHQLTEENPLSRDKNKHCNTNKQCLSPLTQNDDVLSSNASVNDDIMSRSTFFDDVNSEIDSSPKNLSIQSGELTEEYSLSEFENESLVFIVKRKESPVIENPAKTIENKTVTTPENKAVNKKKEVKILSNEKLKKSINTSNIPKTQINISHLVINKSKPVARKLFTEENVATKNLSLQVSLEAQEDLSVSINSNLLRKRMHVSTQVKSQEIIDEIRNLEVRLKKTKQIEKVTTTKKNEEENNREKITISGVKKNEAENKQESTNVVKRNEEKNKFDKRYSEENHIRLCTNIHKIGDWVLGHFGKLFTASNLEIFIELLSLENILHKAFCLRLYTRQVKWYILDDLCKILNIAIDKTKQNQMLELLVKKKLIENGVFLNFF